MHNSRKVGKRAVVFPGNSAGITPGGTVKGSAAAARGRLMGYVGRAGGALWKGFGAKPPFKKLLTVFQF